jgi:serralysin
VFGNLGADTCDGEAGDDVVRGGQGDDSVRGGDGNDFVSGDRGSDTVSGGLGADTFHTFGDNGTDRVLDFSRAQGDRVLVSEGATWTVSQQGADVIIDLTGGGRMVLEGVQLSTLTDGWISAV